ncbi:hypothetical protein [Rhizobium sp. BR 362]|uniref:hypothetical protein n=1 Tax=Rhizobium sp. BR 362 TaxID=3040670 RepID=UPI002F40D885
MEAEDGNRSDGPQILNARDVAADFQDNASRDWNAIANALPAGLATERAETPDTPAKRLGGRGGLDVTGATISVKTDDFPPVS